MIPLETLRPPLLLSLALNNVSVAIGRCLLSANDSFFPALPAKNRPSKLINGFNRLRQVSVYGQISKLRELLDHSLHYSKKRER